MTDEPHLRSRAELAISRHANEMRVSFIYDSPEDAETAMRSLTAMRQMHGAITITIYDPDVLQKNMDPGRTN